MPKQKKMTIPEQIAHEEKYVEFLRNRLASENYKANASAEDFALSQKKYDKAKFRLKTLRQRTK